jgi:zinc transport system ATP-binding protein
LNQRPNKRDCADGCCLKLQNICVRIGNETILDNLSFHLHCGEMTALIGPNGAGKSTILKTILGQQEYEGVISFSSPGLRHRRPPRIGYVPQSPSFDPGDPLSVADLFACCQSTRPVFWGSSKEMRAHILESLERVKGTDLIDKRVGTLSGGELQRVLLALALDPLPNILILDEPFSGVDAAGNEELMEMLNTIRQNYDLSILMTTHDFSILRKHADQVILVDGTVLQAGTPDSVLSSNAFTRLFHRKEADE